MAKITRKTQKIFAENSGAAQVTAFGSIKVNSPNPPVYTKDPDVIQSNEYLQGWSGAVQDDYAPYRQDMNAIQLLITRQLAYLYQAGIPEYDSATQYYANCSFCQINGKIYLCTQDALNKLPTTEPTYWAEFDLSSFAPINSPVFTGIPAAPTPASTDNSTKIATTAFVKDLLGAVSGVRTGVITSWGGSSVPSGYLLCDGSEISRSTYSDLFAAIGTTWGTGDGSTTFNVPNFIDCIPWGANNSIGTYSAGQAPQISGKFTVDNESGEVSGCFYVEATGLGSHGFGGNSARRIVYQASRSSSIYQNTSIIRPASINTLFLIKY